MDHDHPQVLAKQRARRFIYRTLKKRSNGKAWSKRQYALRLKKEGEDAVSASTNGRAGKRKRIGDYAIEVMREERSRHIGYNEFGMLDEVWSRAERDGVVKAVGSRGGRYYNDHPITRQCVVLDALDRDPRFAKFYIRCIDRRGVAERRVREYELKQGSSDG